MILGINLKIVNNKYKCINVNRQILIGKLEQIVTWDIALDLWYLPLR